MYQPPGVSPGQPTARSFEPSYLSYWMLIEPTLAWPLANAVYLRSK
jgi:hypothetical protein